MKQTVQLGENHPQDCLARLVDTTYSTYIIKIYAQILYT